MIGAHQTTGSSANSGSAETPVWASGAAKKPAANSRESPGRNGEEHDAGFDEHNQEDETKRGGDAHGDPAGDRRARILEQINEEVDNSHEMLSVSTLHLNVQN